MISGGGPGGRAWLRRDCGSSQGQPPASPASPCWRIPNASDRRQNSVPERSFLAPSFLLVIWLAFAKARRPCSEIHFPLGHARTRHNNSGQHVQWLALAVCCTLGSFLRIPFKGVGRSRMMRDLMTKEMTAGLASGSSIERDACGFVWHVYLRGNADRHGTNRDQNTKKNIFC